MQLPNCVGVYDVVATPQSCKIEMDECPKCHSDDIIIKRRQALMLCEVGLAVFLMLTILLGVWPRAICEAHRRIRVRDSSYYRSTADRCPWSLHFGSKRFLQTERAEVGLRFFSLNAQISPSNFGLLEGLFYC